MATPVDPDFRARLAALNEKFAATVPGTLAKIRAALDECQVGGEQPSQAALYQLHEVLHGVAGSAGTFGFTVFGQEARRVEQLVRAVLSSNSGWPPVVPEVEKLLAWATRDAKATSFE